MVYDEGLAQRIRDALDTQRDVVEKKMFGGIAFMVNGHMAVGVVKDDLMVRIGSENHDEAMKEPHTRPMDFTGSRMRGMLFVSAEGLDDEDVLRGWVRWASGYALSLPPKEAKAPQTVAKKKTTAKKSATKKSATKKSATKKSATKKSATKKKRAAEKGVAKKRVAKKK